MKRIPIIMDVDTGVDDAIALYLAAGSDELEIKGITVVAGNQTLEKTLRNTLKIAELLKLNVPVAKGSSRPILGKGVTAEVAHGDSGLGFYVGEETKYPVSKLSAVELMADIISNSKERITLVPTGPLTNIATFFLSYPHLKERVEKICLMGGGSFQSNQGYVAEFNFYCDPEAANIVFNSGIPIIMCGLDVTHKAYITREEIDKMVANDSELAKITKQMLDFYYNSYRRRTKLPGAILHDSVAVAYLINKNMFTGFDAYVTVDLEGQYTRGSSIVDKANTLKKKPNAFVVADLDREELIRITIERFQQITRCITNK